MKTSVRVPKKASIHVKSCRTQLVPLFHPDTVYFLERLWKSAAGCDCSVKSCWGFTPPGASPWRCSRPGCLCGDCPKMSWSATLRMSLGRVRSKGAIAEGLEMLTLKLRNVFLGWPTKSHSLRSVHGFIIVVTCIFRTNNLLVPDEWIKGANWTPEVRGCYQSELSRRDKRLWCKDDMTVTVICTCSLLFE